MTKRKSEEQKTKTVRKKRQAFGAVKDRAILAKSEHNEKESTLSKLPREIRTRIWRYVLGDTTLHLYQSDYSMKSWAENVDSDDEEGQAQLHPWRLAVCCEERSLPQLYEFSKTPENTFIPCKPGYSLNEEYWNALSEAEKLKSLQYERSSMFSHHECIDSLFEDVDALDRYGLGRTKRQWVCNLALLQTCRMVYHEANHVLWTTNTFSFDDYDHFAAFIKRRSTLQTQLLAKLHFMFKYFEYGNMSLWQKSISPATIKKLKGLKSLHVYMEEAFLHLYLDDPDRMEDEKQYATKFLLNFRVHPLTAATFIIKPGSRNDTPNLTHAECLNWAEELRSKLLDPDAAANLEADRAAEMAEKAKHRAWEKSIEQARRARRLCSFNTAEECRKDNQERQDEKDARQGRKRKKPFIAEDCGCQHKGEKSESENELAA